MVIASAANLLWMLANRRAHAAFVASLDRVEETQGGLLTRYLGENAQTVFGRAHGFAEIKTYAQFARRVPLQEHHDLEPWIKRIREGEQCVLTRQRVRRLVPTGGSSGGRKLIPYTSGMQEELNRAVSPWVYSLYHANPGMVCGPSYWSISPVGMGESEGLDQDPSAVPIGFDNDADYLGGWRARLVSAAMAVPSEVGLVRSIEDWRRVTVLHLLARADLGFISIWHPSFLDLLLDYLCANRVRLLEDLRDGVMLTQDQMMPRATGPLIMRGRPARAAALRHADPANIRSLWPRLKVVSCWADAGAGPAARLLAQRLGDIDLEPKGLLATEGVVSIPFEGKHPLAIRSHFFEFEDDQERVCPAWELREGKVYRVLITTAGGLCRYRMHDTIRVEGMMGQTPSVRFLGKEGLMCDLAGEKLTDGFVGRVFEEMFKDSKKRSAFLMLAPDASEAGPGYTVYSNDRLSGVQMERIDQLLCVNPHYAYARRLGQIQIVRQFWIENGFYGDYVSRLMGMGMRLGDIKPSNLSRLDGWSDCFSGRYVERECGR